MKLLRIHLVNLNSLYGESTIDLEKELGGAPIFLIEGKTGSGKSTLMDAVCLALFGETPRLGARKGDDDHDPRLVMSRGTWHSSAQLEFSKIEAGVETRYRATWECHRAKKKADGTLQLSQRSLQRWDGTKWEELVSSKLRKEFEPQFAKVLEGMTVEDFKRTVLLAQGEFAAFLKVDDTERARILERLTSTSQYKLIGARAKERARQAQQAAMAAEASKNAVRVLSDDEEKSLVALFRAAKLEERRLQEDSSRARAHLKWCTDVNDARQRLQAGMQELERANANLREKASDLARVADHERCAGAGLFLRGFGRSLQTLEVERSNLGVLETDHASAGAQRAVAQESLEKARAVLAERNADAKALEPQILEARRLRSELGTAQAELKKALKSLEEASSKRTSCEQRLATSLGDESEAARELAEAEGLVAELSRFQPLVESLQVLQSNFDSLRAGERELAAIREQIKVREGSLSLVRTKCEELAGKIAGLRQLVSGGKDALAETASKLSEVLGPNADAAAMRNVLRDEERAAQKLQQTIKDATRLLGEEQAALEEKASFEAAAAQHRQECTGLESSIADGEGELATATAALELKGQDLEHLRWAQSIARERGRLKADEACPLCGSKEHPAIADGRFADEDRRIEERCQVLDAEIASAQKELKAREKRLEKLGKSRIAAEQQAAFAEKQAADRRAKAQATRKSIEALQSSGGTDFSASGAIALAEESVAAAQRFLEERRLQLETSDKQVAEAQKSLVDAERKLAAAEAEAKDRSGEKSSLEATLTVLTAREKDTSAASDDQRRRLIEAFESFGIRSEIGDLSACLKEAGKRAESWKAADTGAAAAREKLASSRAQREKAEALRSERVEAETVAAANRQAREEHAKHLLADVAQVLGGADPGQVQNSLELAVQKATEESECCKKVVDGLDRKLSELDGRITSAKTRVQEGTAALESLRRQLDAALAELGLATDQELEARLLDEELRSQLAEERQRLQKEVQDWTTRSAERQKALDDLLQIRPEGADETAPLDELQQRVAGLEESRERALQDRIKQEQALAHQQQDREQAESLRAASEKARAEAEVWQRLDSLIGTNEGGAFQLFAQTLNLQELVGRANCHLERLSNRYTLVGAPGRLAFMIRDEWQAGEERPLTTLSGGETFLVSLSLALALADYRTVSMPIETLLLDEGFGTLDRETLDTAMQALESLHAGGMQVGVISHVEALKDKIPARIHLENLGNGRSAVSIPRD